MRLNCASLFALLLLAMLAAGSAAKENVSQPKLKGRLSYPESKGVALITYCNFHGPAFTYPGFKEITAETKADPEMKKRWQQWSYRVVDELRSRWAQDASLAADCDVCPITVRNRKVIVDRKHFYGRNEAFNDEVYDCLKSMENDPILDLPKGTCVDHVTFWASFAAGPGATSFDSAPGVPETALLGRPCPAGAESHFKFTIAPPPSTELKRQPATSTPAPLSLFKFLMDRSKQ